MPPLTTALLQRYGEAWTHALSINDLTFDFMAPVARRGRHRRRRQRRATISAGDGSEVAFQRIRQGEYQAGTVAEPLRLQGWQIVDEANRALARRSTRGYVAPAAPLPAVQHQVRWRPEEHLRPRQRLHRRLPEDLGQVITVS